MRAAIDRHTRALADGDAAAYCGILTPGAQLLVLGVMRQPCGAGMREFLARDDTRLRDPVRVEHVRIRGHVATGAVRYDRLGRAPAALRRIGGRWLVDLESEADGG